MSRDWSRYEAVWEYHRQGKTNKEIGKLMERSGTRINQMLSLYRRHQLMPNKWRSLNYAQRIDVLTNCARRPTADWMKEYANRCNGFIAGDGERPRGPLYEKLWLMPRDEFLAILKTQLDNKNA